MLSRANCQFKQNIVLCAVFNLNIGNNANDITKYIEKSKGDGQIERSKKYESAVNVNFSNLYPYFHSNGFLCIVFESTTQKYDKHKLETKKKKNNADECILTSFQKNKQATLPMTVFKATATKSKQANAFSIDKNVSVAHFLWLF